jgi:hypothetical protein
MFILEKGKQKEAQAWWKCCSVMFLAFRRLVLPNARRFWASFPRHSWYITRIFLAAVLEGWATQSPISQEFF